VSGRWGQLLWNWSTVLQQALLRVGSLRIGKGEELSSTLWDSLPGVLNRLRGQ
jgi:hypothetical protein